MILRVIIKGMYTTSYICFTCGNPAIANANERFYPILDGKINDEEVFTFLSAGEYYAKFREQRQKGTTEALAFREALKGSGRKIKYEQFLETKERKWEAPDVYALLDISEICCKRCVFSPPVWSNYNTSIPPDSAIELDTGTVERYSIRRGMKFDVGEIKKDENVESGGNIIETVELNVTEEELAMLDV